MLQGRTACAALWRQEGTQMLPALCGQFWQTIEHQRARDTRGKQGRLTHAAKTMGLRRTRLLLTPKQGPAHTQGTLSWRFRLREKPAMNLSYGYCW